MNPYEILGVPVTASDDQLRSAYRKAARATHPDNGGDGDEFAKVKALEDRQFLLARITRHGDGENLFANIIKDQIKQLEPVVRAAALDVTAMEMAVEELMHYENEVDLIQSMQMMQYGGNFAAQNQTRNGLWFTTTTGPR